MTKQAIFDVSEVLSALHQALFNSPEIDVNCAEVGALCEWWLADRITRIHHIPFADGAVTNDYEPFPEVQSRISKTTQHVDSLFFHWCRFPIDIECITGFALDGVDLLIEYQPKGVV